MAATLFERRRYKKVASSPSFLCIYKAILLVFGLSSLAAVGGTFYSLFNRVINRNLGESSADQDAVLSQIFEGGPAILRRSWQYRKRLSDRRTKLLETERTKLRSRVVLT